MKRLNSAPCLLISLPLPPLKTNFMKLTTNKMLIALFFVMSFFYSQTANSQVLISLLLGDKLNTGQIEFGLEGGYNRAFMSGISESKGANFFNIGFYFDFKLKKTNPHWFVNTGVRVKSNSGATDINVYSLDDADIDTVLADGYVTRKIAYFYVPMHIKYRFAKHFFVNAGFTAGLRSKARDLFYNTVKQEDDVEFTNDIRDNVKRLDFGLSGGVGYKIHKSGLSVGITYYHGLVDVMKNTGVSNANRAFYFYVCVPVGAGKKDEKKEK